MYADTVTTIKTKDTFYYFSTLQIFVSRKGIIQKKVTVIPTGELRLEGIQLCMVNAKRLIEDSENVSEITATSLLELALEEITKGFMLLNRGALTREEYREFTVNLKEVLNDSDFDEEDERSIEKFYRETGYGFFKELTVENDFENHEEKLKYLAYLITYLKYLVVPVLKHADLKTGIGKIYGKFIRIEPGDILEGVEDMVDQLEMLDQSQIRELSRLKNDGFYVKYANGHFFYPSLLTIHLETLRELAIRLLSALSGVVSTSRY